MVQEMLVGVYQCLVSNTCRFQTWYKYSKQGTRSEKKENLTPPEQRRKEIPLTGANLATETETYNEEQRGQV